MQVLMAYEGHVLRACKVQVLRAYEGHVQYKGRTKKGIHGYEMMTIGR